MHELGSFSEKDYSFQPQKFTLGHVTLTTPHLWVVSAPPTVIAARSLESEN